MSSSYDRNIERIKSRERANVQQASAQRTAMAETMGKRGIQDAKNVASQLENFSSTLREMRKKDIQEKLAKGKLAAQDQAGIDAKKLVELQKQLSTLTETDSEYHRIKNEMIKLEGPNIYPDADRIAHLSPWAQVGFMKEKLNNFNKTFPDKLAYAMANSEKAITIQNMTFTPKQLHENNIHGLPFKEAAMHIVADDIRKNAGLSKFSPELLELAGTNAAIQKAKESVTATYRKRYNIESSSLTRSQASQTWKTSSKTGEDIYHFLIKTSATVDGENKWLGNSGGWKAFDQELINEAVRTNNLDHINKVLDQEIPPALAKQLGVEKGTTFAEHWKNKIPELRSQAKKAIVKAREAEEKFINSEKTALNNKYKTIIRNLPNGELLNGQEIEAIKQDYNRIGEVPPDFIVKYETASLRNERLDKAAIKNLMASQDGAIYHDQLDEFHPLAALEYRKEADRHETALKKTYNVEGLIKAELNETWSDAGIKQNEKKPVWEFALAEANAAYTKNFNRLIKLGYPPDEANRLALHAKVGEVKGEDDEPVNDFEGVVAHLNRTGVKNDYTRYGEEANASLKDAEIMVSKIREGKDFMRDNPTAIVDKVIGGKYGQNHLNTIKQNMETYGVWKGIRMSKDALYYYEGLARGKRKLSGLNLIDAQLKADGHPGIWPDRKDTSDNDYTEQASSIFASTAYEGSFPSYLELINNQEDLYTYQEGTTSVWNLPENLNPILDDSYFDINVFGENN
tara:strand:+ start:729 stop:2954 length:2226 start_codon:yes stop_codon:yes gene_type:complete